MKYRVAAVAGVLVLLVAAVFAILETTNGDDPTASGDGGADATIVQVAASPAPEQVAGAVAAEPPADAEALPLTLTAPADVRPGGSVTFGASWVTAGGDPVSGEVDLQRIEGNSWATVTTVPVESGRGEVEVQVQSSGIYRLAYGGGPEVEAVASHEVVVTAGTPLVSRITATAEKSDDGVGVTAAWTTEGGVPIVGDIGLEQQSDGEEWAPVSAVTTTGEGTAVAEATAEHTTRFRFSYAGGSRFGAVVSEEAIALGDDVRTIPVETCDDDVDIDNLGRGVGCHYTPVESGTFVVAHDYLGNSWWNSIPTGTFVQLEGEFTGLYEVVDRVIAQGRGSALGSASNWTCGDDCDIVLQTCQGSNTGFTWLRKAEGEEPPAEQPQT
ncbi:hypothetical protein E1212_16860 [Jiangella ureilytica]|uniref:Uncharacterized protein n=1 Tax=Jiangella ureilytica TaxID=2530374 RepID=A0A4R4RMQ6_9ACTN|nr:hypothetical protein [Jiangella ureilytica]TDC49803.1 hypothetical protein E1212_16860 [Jiangella ureilytica]